MGKKGKSYRGQRAKKDIGCGCWLCTGYDKEYRSLRLQEIIDEEADEEVNNFILPDVISCDHETEIEIEEDGVTKIICGYCKKEKLNYL